MLQAVAGFDRKDPGSAERPVPDFSAAFVPDLKGWRIGVVRHFWEEDLPASEEERAAMDAALDVLRDLGATLENVRLRSLQEYFDVKIIVAESEIHSVHQRDLQQRPGDFGADFMGKIMLACLFSSSDYVQAQRTRRQMLEEMEPIYARYDVLVTAGMSPAPKFAEVRIIDFWEKPNMTTPFSVTAGPALSLCNGFTEKRAADVDAACRPTLRRDQDAAGRLRLRGGPPPGANAGRIWYQGSRGCRPARRRTIRPTPHATTPKRASSSSSCSPATGSRTCRTPTSPSFARQCRTGLRWRSGYAAAFAARMSRPTTFAFRDPRCGREVPIATRVSAAPARRNTDARRG